MRGLVPMAIELHDDQGAFFPGRKKEGVPGHGCIAVLPRKYKYGVRSTIARASASRTSISTGLVGHYR